MRELGVVADLQPAWLYLDGATLREQFGDERLAYFQPYKTLFEQRRDASAAARTTCRRSAACASVNPYNPFLGMWTTIARQPRGTKRRCIPSRR